MPFPWKKVKNTKISQLVSDHLESQRRRRGHLVVETGFPTSLVDLFVKNRDRLKKPKSSKKKKTQNIDNSSSLNSSSSSCSTFRGTNPSPFPSPSISRTPSSLSLAPAPAQAQAQSMSSSLPASNKGVQEVDEEMNEPPNAKGVIGAVLRIFFVVVLALGAKKFAVGLTMSAFLLCLLEYVAKHSNRLLVPCSEANRRLRLMMQRILQVVGFGDKILYGCKSSDTGSKGQLEASSEFNNHGDTSSISEIQIGRSIFVENIQGVRKEIGESSSDRREFLLEKEIVQPSCDGKSQHGSDSKMMINQEKEVEYGCVVSDSKKGESKRARIKLKMKRLVPRKLRGSKKEKRDLEAESSPIKEKIVAVLEDPAESAQGDARNLECDSKLSLLSVKHERNDPINVICSTGVVAEKNVEEIVIMEEQEKPRQGKSGYLILCLIVLVGLVGGRIIAFMLMVIWFLILKSGERLRKYIKLPAISRSLTEKSSQNFG